MQKHGVAIIDLYGLVVNKPGLRARPDDLYHYNAKGRTMQGRTIAAKLADVLPARVVKIEVGNPG